MVRAVRRRGPREATPKSLLAGLGWWGRGSRSHATLLGPGRARRRRHPRGMGSLRRLRSSTGRCARRCRIRHPAPDGAHYSRSIGGLPLPVSRLAAGQLILALIMNMGAVGLVRYY